MLPGFVETLSKFGQEKLEGCEQKEKTGKTKQKFKSLELAKELQLLLAYLWNSNRKYISAETFTEKLTDDHGCPIKAESIGKLYKNLLLSLNEALELEDSPLLELSDIKESQVLGMSELPPATSDQLAKTFILNTFFGSFKVFTKATDKDGFEAEVFATNAFGYVVVDADEESIYKGWEANYFAKTDSVQTPSVILFRVRLGISS
jgi:hypothetical protein